MGLILIDKPFQSDFNGMMEESSLPFKNSSELIPKKQPRSLVVPLVLIFFGVALVGGYIYLKTTYPAVFANPFENIYNAIVPVNRRAAVDQLPMPTGQSQISSYPLQIASPKPSPTHSPYPLIPDTGRTGTFKVSHGSGSGPTITNLSIDPLDAKVGDTVKVTLTLTHPTPVKSIKSKITTDKTPINTAFTLVSRIENTELWQAEFKLDQPFLYNYVYHFDLSDGINNSQLDVALRN